MLVTHRNGISNAQPEEGTRILCKIDVSVSVMYLINIILMVNKLIKRTPPNFFLILIKEKKDKKLVSCVEQNIQQKK